MAVIKQPWYVYMLTCADGTLYTGITTDIERRVSEHNEGKLGAKYTRIRRPVRLAYHETCESRSSAAAREATLRKLPRQEKLKLTGFTVRE